MSAGTGADALQQDWLYALSQLLIDLAPAGLWLLRLAPAQDLSWHEGAPDTALVIAGSCTTAPCRDGWLLRLPGATAEPAALYIGGCRTPVDRAQLALAASLCRTAWKCANWHADGSEARLDETAEAVHALRNALNAVVMHAAVLAQCPLSERAQGIVHELESGLGRSLEALHRFALLAR